MISREQMLIDIETMDGDIGLEHVDITTLILLCKHVGISSKGSRLQLAVRLKRLIMKEAKS